MTSPAPALETRFHSVSLKAQINLLSRQAAPWVISTAGDSQHVAHKSFPPFPGTMKEFIGRFDLAFKLWDWFVFGRNPRLYLSGPGGSGKSTLAFEFAEKVADNASNLVFANGEKVDYVLFLSAKETEFNVILASEQDFQPRQFSNVREMCKQILIHSGLHTFETISGKSEVENLELLNELFDNFNGLIVLDDIDALSRSGVDTGEEELFLKASQARKTTKIVYTVRGEASYAKNASIPVPGLAADSEFPVFLTKCCEQFDVFPPNDAQIKLILKETSALPLLIETIIGLRKSSSTYEDALRDLQERGGDGARKYLYQREYNKLAQRGKSRQVLAALMEHGGAIDFDSIMTIISSNSEQTRDAINETLDVFLKVQNGKDDETLYLLSPPAVPFIRTVSRGLPYIPKVIQAVNFFKKTASKSTRAEATIILKMQQHLKFKQYDEVIRLDDVMEANNPITSNPKYKSLLGQAFVQCRNPDLQKARELFGAAKKFGHNDTFMMRAWYYAEKNTGYRFKEAAEICRLVIGSVDFNNLAKSEFYAKLGDCLNSLARSQIGVSPEEQVRLLSESVDSYVRAIWICRNHSGSDTTKTIAWLQRAASNLFQECSNNFKPYFITLERLAKSDVDLHDGCHIVILSPLRQLARTRERASLHRSQKILAEGSSNLRRLAKHRKPLDGFEVFLTEVDKIIKEIQFKIAEMSANQN